VLIPRPNRTPGTRPRYSTTAGTDVGANRKISKSTSRAQPLGLVAPLSGGLRDACRTVNDLEEITGATGVLSGELLRRFAL
jgi:hypothetical protein